MKLKEEKFKLLCEKGATIAIEFTDENGKRFKFCYDAKTGIGKLKKTVFKLTIYGIDIVNFGKWQSSSFTPCEALSFINNIKFTSYKSFYKTT